MASEQKVIFESFLGAEPLPVLGEALVPRLKKAMYAGSGSDEALAAWDKELGQKVGHFFADLEAGKFDSWVDTPEGLIATVLLCDQLSRNVFRNTARAWAFDERAQAAVKKAVDDPVMLNKIMSLHPSWAFCLIHVFLHAENVPSQEFGMKFALSWLQNAKDGKYGSVAETDINAMEDMPFFVYIHADVIRRFGRFASRNQFLGRENSPAENEALANVTCFGAKGYDMGKAKADFLNIKSQGKLFG